MTENKTFPSYSVLMSVYEKEQRMKLYEEKLDEMLDDDVVMIDTEGAKIGQINGVVYGITSLKSNLTLTGLFALSVFLNKELNSLRLSPSINVSC